MIGIRNGLVELREWRKTDLEGFLACMKALPERQDKIVSFFLAGKTAQEVADLISGITRTRAGQIFSQAVVNLRKAKLRKERQVETESLGEDELVKMLNTPVELLPLSVGTLNRLRSLVEERPVLVRDIVVRTEHELLMFRNFGKRRLSEVRNFLESRDLWLGTDPSWPPLSL